MLIKRILFVVVLVPIFFCATKGKAETVWVPPSERVTTSYRSQMLIADGLSLALIVGGEFTEKTAISQVGVGTYLLGAPALHAAHGSLPKALLSLGLRSAIPFGLAIASASATEGSESSVSDIGGALILGLVVGSGIGLAIDYVYLGTATKRRPPPKSKKGLSTLRPSLLVLPERAQVGLSMTF